MKLFTKLDTDGKELPNDATDHAVLVDHTLGLMIDVRDAGELATHYDAPAQAEALTLLGHSDWRLAMPKEAFNQIDHTTLNPYADKKLYPKTRTDRLYWTAQVDPELSDFAFAVYFYYGYADWNNRSVRGVVRAVRSLAPPPGQ